MSPMVGLEAARRLLTGAHSEPATAARRCAGLEFIKVEGAPHLLPWTHPDVVDPGLLNFCGK